VEIAHGIPKTEHTYWLHQFACKVIKQMAEWGPLPDVAAFTLEREGGEIKKQVHTSNEPEKTFIKRWQEKAVTSFAVLGEARKDIQEQKVFPGFEITRYYGSRSINLTQTGCEMKLSRHKRYLKPKQSEEVLRFVASCWQKIPQWQRLSRQPHFEKRHILKCRKVCIKGVQMSCTSSNRGQLFGGGSSFLTLDGEALSSIFDDDINDFRFISERPYAACVEYYVRLSIASGLSEISVDLAKVQLFQTVPYENESLISICDTSLRKPDLKFLPICYLKEPCMVAPVPSQARRWFFIQIDQSEYLPYSLQNSVQQQQQPQQPQRQPQQQQQEMEIIDLDRLDSEEENQVREEEEPDLEQEEGEKENLEEIA